MDLENSSEFSEDHQKGGDLFSSTVSCSICLECVVDQGERSIAKLYCGHRFHLDCIGSAFNAKGSMQCPNCRKVEKGQWLYANGYCSLAEFNVDELVHEDLYDLSYSELPFGLHWCPFRGFTQLSSLFEEGESHSNASLGDHSNASSDAHVCPYLALHGFPHPAHPTPSNSSETVADSNYFHRHPTGLGRSSSGDLLNSRSFSATEPHHHNWQQPSLPLPVAGGLLNNSEQPTSQMPRLPRSDSNGQQRIGSFMHPLPLLRGSITRTNSNIVGPMVPPILGDGRGPRIRGHNGHIYPQQSAVSLPARNAPYAPIRRSGPRTVALVSSMGTNSYAENSRFYGFSMSGSVNRNRQDSEIIGRRFDRVYGWGREGFAPLPWVPVEGESQWWGPPPSNQNRQTGNGDSVSRRFDYIDKPGGQNTDIIIRAIHDIQEGREICLSYFPVNWNYADRQVRLLEDYGFVCNCDRCEVEKNWSEEENMEEDGEEMVSSGEENGEELDQDFPHAYFFARYLCDRDNCGGTMAPLQPSEGKPSDIMECNVCGKFRRENEVDNSNSEDGDMLDE